MGALDRVYTCPGESSKRVGGRLQRGRSQSKNWVKDPGSGPAKCLGVQPTTQPLPSLRQGY